MSVLKRFFDSELNQSSPVQIDYFRKVNYDEKGNEFITYEPVDYCKLKDSLGSSLDWSLNVLLKAGVNPDFPIRTGFNTRLEGIDVVRQYAELTESVLSEVSESSKEE